MLAKNGRMKIALQRTGRLTDDSVALLRACGLDFEFRSQNLYSPSRNFPLDILAIRDDDIPEYVQDGVADLGIVGQNIIDEKRADVSPLLPLGFGKCRLMISVPMRSSVKKPSDLRNKRIGTTYPTILRAWLAANNVKADIVRLSGSVELAPTLDVADAICDITSTGTTARMNGLKPVLTVMESEAVLVANRQSLKSPRQRATIDRLLIRAKGFLEARGKRYLMMNAPARSVQRLRTIIPGLKSPTIMPLADTEMVAVHSVVPEDIFWDVMERLKKAGARDIIVTPIETIIR